MTFASLWKSLRIAWQSRPFAIILPIVALGWYWYRHGHVLALATFGNGGSLPAWPDLIAGIALLTTKFERLTALFLGAPSPETLPTPVASPVLVKGPGDGPKVGGLVLLLGLGLALNGCATVPAGDGGATPTQAFGHCTTSALTTSAEGILGDVTTALATGDYVDAVANLATKFGTAEVGCAIDLVIAEFTAKASRSDDSQVGVILAHAQALRLASP